MNNVISEFMVRISYIKTDENVACIEDQDAPAGKVGMPSFAVRKANNIIINFPRLYRIS